jgi:hypothetical protein
MPNLSRAWRMALAVGVGVLILAAPGGAIDPKQLPPDSEMVLTINVRQIVESDLVKSNKDVMAQVRATVDTLLADQGVQRYLEKIDFDLFRDLSTVTVASTGGKSLSFVMLEGTFNAEKIQATGEEASKDNAENIKPIKIGGQAAFEIRVTGDDKPLYAGLVGKSRLIASDSKDGFAAAITRLDSDKPSKLKKELRDVIAAASAKQSISLVATGPALVKLVSDAPVPNIDALQSVLEGISALQLSIAVAKNVHFELVVNANDKKSAEEMSKFAAVGLAGAKVILKDKVKTEPKYAPAMDIVSTMKVSSKGNNLVLQGEIAAPVLAKILKELPTK